MNDEFLYYNKKNEYIVKILGKATMKNVKTLSEFVDKLLSENSNISLEMSEVAYMDSTFLGLIAKLAISIKTKFQIKLKIINPNDIALNYLKQTGILKFVEVIKKEDILGIDLKGIEKSTFENNNEKSKYILEMHEVLMDLNEENKIEFKAVVDAMKKVIE